MTASAFATSARPLVAYRAPANDMAGAAHRNRKWNQKAAGLSPVRYCVPLRFAVMHWKGGTRVQRLSGAGSDPIKTSEIAPTTIASAPRTIAIGPDVAGAWRLVISCPR